MTIGARGRGVKANGGGGLCGKVGDGGMCAGARAFGIAVDAASRAPGSVAVGAGKARVERHLLHALTKALFEIGVEGVVEHAHKIP